MDLPLDNNNNPVPILHDSSGKPIGLTNPLSISDARPPATDALYALSGNGAAAPLPAGAVMVELVAVGSDLWFRFGGDVLPVVAVPSGAMPSGAPRFLPQGGSILVDVRQAT